MSRFKVLALLLAVVSPACRGQSPGGGDARPSGSPTAAARGIQVEEGRVVVQGRWQPIETTAQQPPVAHTVRIVCTQDRGRCREEGAAAGTGATTRDPLDYDVKEWTSWKLVAGTRTAAGDEYELQVALRGAAATKAFTRKGSRTVETRWRLE